MNEKELRSRHINKAALSERKWATKVPYDIGGASVIYQGAVDVEHDVLTIIFAFSCNTLSDIASCRHCLCSVLRQSRVAHKEKRFHL
jgi:hypothetical protein